MTAARKHAEADGVKVAPVLSPVDVTLLGEHPAVDVAALHAAGFHVIPWTTDDEAKMHALIALHVDGDITDRPDLLQKVLQGRARGSEGGYSAAGVLAKFVVSAHRGGRGLRPENTLPSFEDGLDHLATELETDTGVSTDHVSLIWHDQFYNPGSCRKADGSAYTMENPGVSARHLVEPMRRRPLSATSCTRGRRMGRGAVSRPDERSEPVTGGGGVREEGRG